MKESSICRNTHRKNLLSIINERTSSIINYLFNSIPVVIQILNSNFLIVFAITRPLKLCTPKEFKEGKNQVIRCVAIYFINPVHKPFNGVVAYLL